MCDWAAEVFLHADLSPLFQTHAVRTLNIALALRRICKQAPLAIAFKPQDACELLKKHTRDSLAEYAAGEGDLLLLQFAMRRGCKTNQVCPSAAYGGHLELLQWARAQDCPWNDGTVSYTHLTLPTKA